MLEGFIFFLTKRAQRRFNHFKTEQLIIGVHWVPKVTFLRDVLNLVSVNFMVLSILGLFLIILEGLSLSFHTKSVLVALKDRK